MAIDALQFRNFLEQFRPDKINRELNKVMLNLYINLLVCFGDFCVFLLSLFEVSLLCMLQNILSWVVPFALVLDTGGVRYW